MADESLFYYPGSESPYGMAGSALAQSLPALVNPYASPGQNLAVTLGGGLIAALLGFKARQQTSEAGIQTQQLANDMLTAESPAARRAIIESAPSGFFEPNVQGRLLKLDTVLTENELKAQQAARTQQRSWEAQARMELSPLGQALNQRKIDTKVAEQEALYQLQGKPEIQAILDAEAERRRRQISGTLTSQDIADRELARLKTRFDFETSPETIEAKEQAAKRKEEQRVQLAERLEKLRNEFKTTRDTQSKNLRVAQYGEEAQIKTAEELTRQMNALRIPSKEYVQMVANREALVAEIDALAERWRTLNGGKGASALEVKANLNNSNTEIGDLRNKVLSRIGAFIQLQGLSKAQSDLDTKLFMRSIFGEFYGIEGALDSKTIAENIRNQIPQGARVTVEDAIQNWQRTIDNAFQNNPGLANNFSTNNSAQAILAQEATNATKLPMIQSNRERLTQQLMEEARRISTSSLPKEEQVQRLQSIKLQIQALKNPNDEALQQQALGVP